MSEGARVIKTPIQAPKANAFTERWVRAARRDCLDHILILSRRHLLRTLREVRGPLQRAETPPGTEARLSVATGPIASRGYDRYRPEARSAVRDDPRLLQGTA